MYNITHDDYSFAERAGEENWVVHLKSGEFADTYYMYGKVQIRPPEGGWDDDGEQEGVLSFTYQVLEADSDISELEANENFNNYIGAVLQHILEDSFAKGDYKIGDNNGESGNDNTEESNQ